MRRSLRTSAPDAGGIRRPISRPPFDCIALLLQGGGALGAYQCGVYQALAEADLHPDWVAGISIGAINAAIIAGNPPEKRVERLRAFWEGITAKPLGGWLNSWFGDGGLLAAGANGARGFLDRLSALQTLVSGAPGFFKPRLPPPWLLPAGSAGSTSFYDTAALRATLETVVDFDRINSKAMRLSVGSVNVRTGNVVYFDTETHTIRPEHIMASGALPPGFPAIEIDGERYWDGGLVSNTPLQWVVDWKPRQDMLAFQVDLWSSRGKFPMDLTEVGVRQKEIQFASRTRAFTDRLKQTQKIRSAFNEFLADAPEALRETAKAKTLSELVHTRVYSIVELIYRSKNYEGNSIDYEFSRRSMMDHWRAGQEDAARTLEHKEIFQRPNNDEGFRTFDFDEHEHAGHDVPLHQKENRR